MPIVVDPGFAWPPETDPVVSPDGRITAIVDPAHAGVLLRANFDDSVPDTPAQPEKVLRRNLAKNPSFEVDLSGWGTPGGSVMDRISGSSVTSGSWLARIVATQAPITPNVYLDAIEPVVESEAGKWAGLAFDVRGRTETANGVMVRIGFFVGGAWTYSTAPAVGINNAWSRVSHAAVIPSGTTQIRSMLYLRTPDNQPLPGPYEYWVDSVVRVTADSERDARDGVAIYFDGDGATSGTKHYRWTGTPHASISEEYTPATPFIPGKPGTVARVRFERQDGSVVRSGNPAWAPGGYAHAYDHEATLGGGTLWRAVPIRFDGTEGEPSEYVGAVIPALTDGWAWLKPVTDPDKAMLLKVEPPDLSYDGRVDTTSIAGAPRPAATWDVLEGFTTQLRSLVREKNVEEQLMALLDEGPVLAQFPACAGLPDFYFIRGKLDLEHVHWDGWPWRRYQWDVVQIDRPDTTDSPLRIPGLSYDTVARDWTTYDQLKSTVESYNKLLEP